MSHGIINALHVHTSWFLSAFNLPTALINFFLLLELFEEEDDDDFFLFFPPIFYFFI